MRICNNTTKIQKIYTLNVLWWLESVQAQQNTLHSIPPAWIQWKDQVEGHAFDIPFAVVIVSGFKI